MRLSFDKLAGIELKPTVTRGGIFVPATHVDTSRTATKRVKITHIGPGFYSIELGRRVTIQEQLGHELEVGDVVVCSRYLYEHDFGGRKLRLFQATDILCVEDPGDGEA